MSIFNQIFHVLKCAKIKKTPLYPELLSKDKVHCIKNLSPEHLPDNEESEFIASRHVTNSFC